jgi:hypothetical protein
MYQKTTTQQADLEQARTFLSLLFSEIVDLIEIRLLPSRQQFFDNDRANILSFIANHLDENVCFRGDNYFMHSILSRRLI